MIFSPFYPLPEFHCGFMIAESKAKNKRFFVVKNNPCAEKTVCFFCTWTRTTVQYDGALLKQTVIHPVGQRFQKVKSRQLAGLAGYRQQDGGHGHVGRDRDGVNGSATLRANLPRLEKYRAPYSAMLPELPMPTRNTRSARAIIPAASSSDASYSGVPTFHRKFCSSLRVSGRVVS